MKPCFRWLATQKTCPRPTTANDVVTTSIIHLKLFLVYWCCLMKGFICEGKKKEKVKLEEWYKGSLMKRNFPLPPGRKSVILKLSLRERGGVVKVIRWAPVGATFLYDSSLSRKIWIAVFSMNLFIDLPSPGYCLRFFFFFILELNIAQLYIASY